MNASPPTRTNFATLWRATLGFALFLVAIPLFAACVYFWTLRTAQAQLRAALAEIQAAGEPLTWAEFEQHVRLPKIQVDHTDELFSAWSEFENVWDRSIFTTPFPFAAGDSAGDELPAAETFLRTCAAEIAEMREALRRQPILPTAENDRSFKAIYPQAVLQLLFATRLHRGDREGAIDAVETLMRVSETFREHPSQQFRGTLWGYAVVPIAELLSDEAASEPELARIVALLEQVDFSRSVGLAVRGDLVSAYTMMNNPADPELLSANDPGPFVQTRPGDVAAFLRFQRNVIQLSDSPLPDVLDDYLARALEVDNPREDLRPKRMRYLLMEAYRGNPAWQAGCIARAQILRDALLTAVAVERIHRARGERPKLLEDLVPQFLPAAPLDPFDRAPLLYRVEDGSYVIYSVGDDKIDQGSAIEGLRGLDIGVRIRTRPTTP